MSRSILGIDIGGTKCAIILGTIENKVVQVVDKKYFLTESMKGFDYTINNIYKHIDDLLFTYKLLPSDIAACGISCGGPLDSKKGIIMSPPNLPGWNNIPIIELIQKRYGFKTGIQNDANACALAEWKYGAAKGYNNVVFLTFGTGMGAGLILDGQLYVGTNDMAGEVGHIRLERFGPVGYGKIGSFEGFCSGGGIAQLAQMKVLEKFQMGEPVSFCKDINQLSAIDAKIVADAAFGGNELALEIFQVCGYYLGHALSVIIDMLNPEIIVIGSIYARSKQLMEKSMYEIIEQETVSHARKVCKIEPAGLEDKIGDYAALSVAAYLL